MQPLEILGRLYTLLSECDSEQLEETAQIVDHPRLREAIHCLAAWKRRVELKSREAGKRAVQSTEKVEAKKVVRDQVVERRHAVHEVAGKDIGRLEVRSAPIFDVISEHFSRNEDLANFLNSLDLPFHIRQKDGRREMLRQMERYMKIASEREREVLIRKLRSVFPQTETSGWFEAIRGAQ